MRFLHRLGPARIVNREAFLIDSARGKKVMHLGCVDSGLLETRIEADDLLPARLKQTSAALWGMDLDAGGIERLRSLGYPNLIVGSAEEPPGSVPREAFDVVIAGELIEHVQNVGRFLGASAGLLRPEGQLIITTPNALRFYNPLPPLLGHELVHPDHLAWFSPNTLKHAAEMAGLSVRASYVYRSQGGEALKSARNPIDWLGRVVYKGVMSVAHPLITGYFPTRRMGWC
jgi:2-polyprenyl-3-methyl-5-hydroxy-6-metoxy-1,4-benzoquinol methylase